MHPFHNILVGLELGPRGIDIGSGSRLALQEAITLARFNEARVTLLHSTAADEHWQADLAGYTYREAGLSEDYIHKLGLFDNDPRAGLPR